MYFDATSYISKDMVLAFPFSFLSGLLYWLYSFWVPFPFPVFFSLRCLVFLGCPVTLNLSGWRLLPCGALRSRMEPGHSPAHLSTASLLCVCVCVCVLGDPADRLFSLRIVSDTWLGSQGWRWQKGRNLMYSSPTFRTGRPSKCASAGAHLSVAASRAGALISSLSWLHSHEPSLGPQPPGC